MTHVIHSFIMIPVTPSLHPKWFASTGTSSSRSATKACESPVTSPGTSASGSPTLGPAKDAKHSAFDRAFSTLTVGRRSLSLLRSGSPHTNQPVDVLLHAYNYNLPDVALTHYLPGNIDPDDTSVRNRYRSEGVGTLNDDYIGGGRRPRVLSMDADLFAHTYGVREDGNCDPRHDVQGELKGQVRGLHLGPTAHGR